MTWTKLSDDFADDCETLTDAAFRLHVVGLVWSARKLLDCHIPTEHLRRLEADPDAVDELLAVGWWTLDGETYVIRHHAMYQQTREQVLKRQAANTANGRKGGRPGRERTPETHSVSDSLTHVARPVANPQGRDGKGSTKDTTLVLGDHACAGVYCRVPGCSAVAS